MADDLAPMTNAEFRELLHRRVEYLLANTYESRHCAYDAELFREAATRLSPPEGDKVEAVARALERALERARHVIDTYAWPHHKNDPINVPGLTIAAVLTEIAEARAALAALPAPTGGEVMREAAAPEVVEAWLRRTYVVQADERQRELGVDYIEAGTADLAKEISRFIMRLIP